MSHARVKGAAEEDNTMGGSATAMMTATVTITVTCIIPEVETGATAAANVQSDPTHLRQVVCMDHSRAPDANRAEGGRGMSPGTTESETTSRNQSSGIRYPTQKRESGRR